MEKKMNYIAPEVEVLEVVVEQGFAQSGGPIDDMGYGSNNWLLDVQNREKILNERERRSQEQQNFENHINHLTQQAAAIGIDLRQEMLNPEFVRLTSPGVNVPVEMAYRLVHQDEILKGGMQYAAQQGAQRVAAAVQAGKSRTVENGMQRKGANVRYIVDPKKMTKEERDELKRRVRAGDTSIVF